MHLDLTAKDEWQGKSTRLRIGWAFPVIFKFHLLLSAIQDEFVTRNIPTSILDCCSKQVSYRHRFGIKHNVLTILIFCKTVCVKTSLH